MPSTVADVLTRLVDAATSAAGLARADVALEPCVPIREPGGADYRTSHPLRLAHALGREPGDVARALVAAIPPNDVLDRAEVGGAGFVDLTVSDRWLARDVAERASARFDTPEPGDGRAIVVVYGAVDPAERLTVDHLRAMVLGDALQRIDRFLGADVVAEWRVADWGARWAARVIAWERWRDEARFGEDPAGELHRLGERFDREAEADPALRAAADDAEQRLRADDPAAVGTWQHLVDVACLGLQALHARLGLELDVVEADSSDRRAADALVDALLADGSAVEAEGVVVVPSDGSADEPVALPLRDADGVATDAAFELAAIRRRVAARRPTAIVYVEDIRREGSLRHVFAVARRLGLADVPLRHVACGLVRPDDVDLAGALDDATERARALVDERSPELPDDERVALAELVGVGALRFALLTPNPRTEATLDPEEAVTGDGASAAYLMYAHARCRSVLRRGNDAGLLPDGVKLAEPAERDVALALARVPEAIVSAGASERPNLLASHLFAVASAFSRLYDACPIVDPSAPEASRSRLALTDATAQALALGLELLGVHAPERL